MTFGKRILTVAFIGTGISAMFSESAFARQISLGELAWMLEHGYSQKTINWIIDDCQGDPDCSFAPIAPPDPDGDDPEDRVQKAKAQIQQVERDIVKAKTMRQQQTRVAPPRYARPRAKTQLAPKG